MMFPIRCPECAQINHRDDLTFPFCSQCHEDLARCGLCRHHEGSGCKHPRAYVRYTPDGEAAKECPEFASLHEVRGSRMLVRLPAPLWVSILLLLILSSLAMAAWFIDPAGRYFRGNPLRVETAVPQQAMAGEPFIVNMLVKNVLDRSSTRFTIEIDSVFLTDAEWAIPSPRPERLEFYRDRLLLEYEPLPRGGQMLLQLPFTPRHEGTMVFTAKIYAPSNQLRRKISVPIQVVPNPRSPTSEGAYP